MSLQRRETQISMDETFSQQRSPYFNQNEETPFARRSSMERSAMQSQRTQRTLQSPFNQALPSLNDPNKFYKISSKPFGFSLHTDDNGKLGASQYHGGTNQMWRFIPFQGNWIIENRGNGRVLDATLTGIAHSSYWSSNSGQVWKIIPIEQGDYIIEQLGTGRILEIDMNGNIFTNTKNGSENQKWEIMSV